MRRSILVGLALLMAPLTPVHGQSLATRIVSAFSGTVATTGTTITAANGSRLAIVCTNEDATIAVYVGGADVTSTGGVRVAGGSSITLTATAQVRARSASGTPTVSCIEELQ